MIFLATAAVTAGKSQLTQSAIASITGFVKNLFGGLGGGGGADGMNKRDEARIARATSYALGVAGGSVDAARYMLGTQASRGAATERAMYDSLVAQQPAATMDAARRLGQLGDTDSGKQGLVILLSLGIGLDVPRAGCFTSTGDPDQACTAIVTQLVTLARAGSSSSSGGITPTVTPATATPPLTAPAAGDPPPPPGSSTARAANTTGALVLGLSVVAFLVFVVVMVRRHP